MKTLLEVNGEEAGFDGSRVRYLNGGVWYSLAKRVGSIVTVCAWCDLQRFLTENIEMEGYNTSHGICETCLDKVLKN